MGWWQTAERLANAHLLQKRVVGLTLRVRPEPFPSTQLNRRKTWLANQAEAFELSIMAKSPRDKIAGVNSSAPIQ
jgi:hypothetical protein